MSPEDLPLLLYEAAIFLLPLSLIPLHAISKSRARRRAQYEEFFEARYDGSVFRVFEESPVDRELLRAWCMEGSRGMKRARQHVELWDPLPDWVITDFLHRLMATPPVSQN